VGAQELSTVLWRERELLELLTFKLEEERLLLTSGNSKWLPFATREVEQVLERIRESGLERAMCIDALSAEWGAGEEPTLRAIIAHAPTDAWRDNFQGHLQALTALASTIAELRDANMQYLRAASRATQDTLANLDASASTYNSHGDTGYSSPVAQLFDGTL
jgi:hypothetical protein